MKKLTLAYFGTPSFSAKFLEKIVNDKTLPIEVKLVVSQPDRPVGKKQILTPSPVKEIAIKYNIAVVVASEVTLREADGGTHSRASRDVKGHERQNLLQSIDLALVCAFGQIIPKNLLSLPKYGFCNIHYSLLPHYRGPSPVAYILMAGEKKTGVTIFQMDEKIDHGPIIAQEEIEILPTEKRPDLETRLTALAFLIFKKLIKRLTEPLTNNSRAAVLKLSFSPQNEDEATYTRLLKKSDGFIPFPTLQKVINNQYCSRHNINMKPCNHVTIYNLFRGLYPWPGIWTILPNGRRLKITQLTINNQQLSINRVQLEGKKEVSFETFNRAYKIFYDPSAKDQTE